MGFIGRSSNRANIAFRKNDNAFLAGENVEALQAAADKLSPAMIRERLDQETFSLAAAIALPISLGSVRYPGINIQETLLITLMEVLLHGGTHVDSWTAKEIHEVVLTTFGLSEKRYRLNRRRHICASSKDTACWSRTDHAIPTASRQRASALLFLFFHKRLCGPLANSRFHHQPDARR